MDGERGVVIASGVCRGVVVGFYAHPGAVLVPERPDAGSALFEIDGGDEPWRIKGHGPNRRRLAFRLDQLPEGQRCRVVVGARVEFRWSVLEVDGSPQRHGDVVLLDDADG